MRVLFMGSGEIALPSLKWLIASTENEVIGVVTQPDKPVGRHQILTASAIKLAALEASIPVFQPLKVRDPLSFEVLAALAPDMIVVMAYGQILPKILLDLPKIACLNLHASLLPLHRGASPIQSAILAGDTHTGITLMHMDVGLDTGDIILTEEIPIDPRDTGGSLHGRLAEIGPIILANGLPLFAENRAPRSPQENSLATHSGKLDRDSGRIDWDKPAALLARQIRAFNPWPGSFTHLPNGKKLKIHAAEEVAVQGKSGEILALEAGRLVVGTARNALQLLEIQLEGRARLPAADFLRGYPLASGTILC